MQHLNLTKETTQTTLDSRYKHTPRKKKVGLYPTILYKENLAQGPKGGLITVADL